MPYDLYPAVDENYDFPPEVRVALSRSLELRHDVEPMTTVLRNNLMASEKWDGRLIVNTDTDRIERYDATAAQWFAIADASDVAKVTSVPTGFRNVIRNGDMQIAQRGNGPVWSNSYLVDGWMLNSGHSGTDVSMTRVIQAAGNGAPLLQIVTTNQTVDSVNAYTQYMTRIEDVETLSGKQVTLSFLAKAGSGTPKLGVSFQQFFGSGGSSVVVGPAGTVTLSTTLTRYSLTFTLPSISGKTIGTNHRLELMLWVSGSNSNYGNLHGNIGLQNNTFQITDVQLEEGPIATPFERIPQQQQLDWCQRYFQRISRIENYRFANGAWTAANESFYPIPFVTTMRATPTVVYVGTFAVYTGGQNLVAPSMITFAVDSEAVTVRAFGYSGGGSGGQVLQLFGGTGGAYIAASAEL